AREGIERQFKLPRERVRVIVEAPDPIFRPLPEMGVHSAISEIVKSGESEFRHPFFLYVGGISPHKNLPALVEAFDHLLQRTESAPDAGYPKSEIRKPESLQLILVGDYKGDVFLSGYEALREEIARRGLEDRVHFTGFISDEDL